MGKKSIFLMNGEEIKAEDIKEEGVLKKSLVSGRETIRYALLKNGGIVVVTEILGTTREIAILIEQEDFEYVKVISENKYKEMDGER